MEQHQRGVDVEEGQPLMSHQRSPSPLLAREAPPSPTLSSYQSFPRTSISHSAPAAPPHHSAQGVLARLNNFLRLAKPLDEEHGDEGRADGCGWFYCGWRARLGHWLEGRRVQYFFISLLVLDIVLLTCELAFEEYFADEEGEEWILIIKEVFEYASVSILLVFAVEVVLLVIAFDLAFFTHPFYVIDAIIIGVSLFFDLYLKEALAGFLVVFRFWRVVRVVHSIVAAEEERHGETKREKRRLEEEIKDYQETIADLQRRLDAKDWALERLREKCAALEQRDPSAEDYDALPRSGSSQSSLPSLSAQLPASAT